jgi:SAM-dependent methyltransferase
MERHRLAWLVLGERTPLLDGTPRRILHFAPEPAIELKLRSLPSVDYRSCDIQPGLAMDDADLSDLHYTDGQFDFVYCSHVLEHVDDDHRALRELRRVLAPSGFGLIMVPINLALTIEDSSVKDPDERARRFGQPDHVRAYGEDFLERLTAAGFNVEVHRSEDVTDPTSFQRMQLYPGERAFIVRPS